MLRAAVFTLTVAGVVGAPNCSNPVFLGDGMFGAPTMPLVSGPPVPFPVGDEYPCQAFHEDMTCCTNQTLKDIQQFFDLGDKILNQTGELIQNNNYPSYIQNMINTQMALVCNSINENLFPSLKSDCEQASNEVSKYSKEISEAAEALVEAELQCARGLSNYYKGMLCYACDAEWEQYLIRDPVSAVIVALNISNDTCTSLVEACAPVNDDVIKIADLAVKLANDLFDILTGGSWPSFNVDLQDLVKDVPDACGGTLGSPGNCETYFCEYVVSGVTVPSQSNWGGASSSIRQLAAVTTNVYSPNGYDAYSIGRADVPDDTFPGWAVAVIVVAALVIVAGVVALVMVRVKHQRGVLRSVDSSRAALTTGHEAPSNAGYGATSNA